MSALFSDTCWIKANTLITHFQHYLCVFFPNYDPDVPGLSMAGDIRCLQTRFNTLISTTIVGVLWGFWHLPPTLPEFFQGTVSFQAFLLSIVLFVGASILITWIFNNAKGSLLLTALFHTSYNARSHFFPVVWQNSSFGPVELSGVLILVTAALVVLLNRSEFLSRQGKRIQERTTPASQV